MELEHLPHRLVSIRMAPNIGLPSLAIAEAFITCEALRAEIASVHRSLEILVVMPIGEFLDLASAQRRASEIAAKEGLTFTTYWPPPMENVEWVSAYPERLELGDLDRPRGASCETLTRETLTRERRMSEGPFLRTALASDDVKLLRALEETGEHATYSLTCDDARVLAAHLLGAVEDVQRNCLYERDALLCR